MTIDELLKVVEKKVSKEEFQAFKIEVEKFFQNYQAMLFYLKPETGIPIEDFNISVQDEINKIKNAYMVGNPIQPEDLPSNVATKPYVDENTQGRIYPSRAKDIIDEVDAIMSLRTQTERHSSQTYASLKDYASDFCITSEVVGDRDIIILHPGPVHRNIDICDALLADKRCKVLEQVANGVAIRMAVLKKLIYDV